MSCAKIYNILNCTLFLIDISFTLFCVLNHAFISIGRLDSCCLYRINCSFYSAIQSNCPSKLISINKVEFQYAQSRSSSNKFQLLYHSYAHQVRQRICYDLYSNKTCSTRFFRFAQLAIQHLIWGIHAIHLNRVFFKCFVYAINSFDIHAFPSN